MPLLQIDNDLSESVRFQFRGAGQSQSAGKANVKFQFPPRIVSDGKSGNWSERDQRGDEPVAAFSTSGARKISLEWTYVVGERGGSDNTLWTVDKVSKEVKGLRSYFHNVPQSGKVDDLIILFKMWSHGGKEPISCRMLDVAVKHGKTLYVPNGNVEEAYPLRTDITVDLRIWTSNSKPDGSEKKVIIKGLTDEVKREWY